MKYSELRRLCDECLYGVAEDIVDNILSGMDEDEEIDLDGFEDKLSEELDSYFTYYSDAWDYLQDNDITDFREAFHEWGATDICQIACYYATEDIRNEVCSNWDNYEDSEESEEEDE